MYTTDSAKMALLDAEIFLDIEIEILNQYTRLPQISNYIKEQHQIRTSINYNMTHNECVANFVKQMVFELINLHSKKIINQLFAFIYREKVGMVSSYNACFDDFLKTYLIPI